MKTQAPIGKLIFPMTMTEYLRFTFASPLTLLLLALPTAVRAQYSYRTNSGTIAITGYSGPAGAVAIPTMINGLQVTSIGPNAFQFRSTVSSVLIPGSVTNVGGFAFSYCWSLTNITIPNSVTYLGSSVFISSSNLSSVTLPESLTYIPFETFKYCTGLTNITIPQSVTDIGEGAFYDCSSLDSVTIPDSVTQIEDYAFYECGGLTNITISSSVTNIGDSAFGICTSMQTITVSPQNPVYSSVEGVLFDKTKTTLLVCPPGKAGSYEIPDSITNIEANAFEFCIDLTSIKIPDSVSQVGAEAFYDCTNLTSVTMGRAVVSMGNDTFFSCNRLMGVYFKGNAPSVGPWSLFYGDDAAIVYYLPGTTGWGPTFGGVSTGVWHPQIGTGDSSFGAGANGFGFTMNWASGMTVVVDTSTNLANPNWVPLATNTFVGDSFYFSDPQWTNYPTRFYRIRWP